MSKSTVGLRLDSETQRRLKELAEIKDRSPHYLMKEAVARYLDEAEEIEAEKQLMSARWQEFAITGEAIPHDEVVNWASSLPKA